MLILKMTSEPQALDELGIGRIRDAFSDKMFPGTSTQQKHLKYFTLLPQVYRKATERRYDRVSEVKAEVVRLERIMTEKLLKASPNDTGIAGSNAVRKKLSRFVKYDPAYIYNSGLLALEILRSTSPYAHIFEASKARHEGHRRQRSDDANTADDADEKAGALQFCAFPNVEYDFTEECSLDLTTADRDFILEHIRRAEAYKGTLFLHLVDHPEIVLPDDFSGLGACQLPRELAAIQDQARRFSDFMCMVYARYNYIRSNYEDDRQGERFADSLEEYRKSGTDIDAVLATVDGDVREESCKTFCKKIAECIANGQTGQNGELDQTIIGREQRVKGTRRKIGNPAYAYDSKKNTGTRLTYRWETIRQFLRELRKEAANV